MMRANERERVVAGESSVHDRVLLALADHFHEHCTCDRLASGELCDSCEVRGQLREIREEQLAWRAAGRRLTQRRDEALANALAQSSRRSSSCSECGGLSGLVRSADS